MKVERAHPTGVSPRRRLLIGAAWGLIQLVVIFAGLLGGGVAAGYLSLDVFTGRWTDGLVDVGLTGGVTAALVVNHQARRWLQRLRLLRLRDRGVTVEARSGLLSKHTVTSRGMSTTVYTARAQWTDPETGVSWQGERRYRFLGRRSRGLEAALAYGTGLRVYYPPGRPSRFIVDIPFAPTMADFFL